MKKNLTQQSDFSISSLFQYLDQNQKKFISLDDLIKFCQDYRKENNKENVQEKSSYKDIEKNLVNEDNVTDKAEPNDNKQEDFLRHSHCSRNFLRLQVCAFCEPDFSKRGRLVADYLRHWRGGPLRHVPSN